VTRIYEANLDIQAVPSAPTHAVRLTDLETKADKSDLETKADKSELETKADKSELTAKADKSELETKADKSELTAKADKSELTSKADKSELTSKADKSELTSKADKSELTAKADKSELETKENKLELMTLAEFTALEFPASSGIYPTLVEKQVVLTDVDTDAPESGGGSYEPPSFAGTFNAEGDMVFYLSPDGDDANDALTPATSGQSLSALLTRLKASDYTLPRDAGVYINMAEGEYTVPNDYFAPFLNRPLTITGPVGEWDDFPVVTINATAITFRDNITVQWVTLKGLVSGVLLTFTGVYGVARAVMFENTSATSVGIALRINYCRGHIDGCAFKRFDCCFEAVYATVLCSSQRHGSDVSTNNYLLNNIESVITVNTYTIAADDFYMKPYNTENSPSFMGLTRFRGDSNVGGQYSVPTGRVCARPTFNYHFTTRENIYRQETHDRIERAANQLSGLSFQTTNVTSIVHAEGWFQIGDGHTTARVGDYWPDGSVFSRVTLYDGDIRFYSQTSYARTTHNYYQIWVEYTKEGL
jgi:hypothetical protein